MKLLLPETGEEIEAAIVEVEEADYAQIKKSKQFVFDWDQEKGNHVFKIIIADEGTTPLIHGLLSLTDRADEFRIHINLIESSNDNKSPNKKIDRVAGCLLSFAVQVAFEKGYFGFTSLIPKTMLIPIYVEKYCFSQYGNQLAIEGKAAIQLIQQYQ
ncbi:MAG: hypothetical protein AAFP02_07590 [Bacteroidota bacterium]